MSDRRDDERFEAELRNGLEQMTRELPPGVETRLAAARREALHRRRAAGGAGRWRMPAMAAMAAIVGVVLVLVWHSSAPPQPELLELAEREELELAEDLEFYLWLDQLTREG